MDELKAIKLNKIVYSWAYVLVFVIPYALVPYIFAYELYTTFASVIINITLLSLVGYIFALYFPVNLKLPFPKLKIDFASFIFLVFCLFILVVLIVFITAPRIPLVESMRGATEEELVQYREEFLKARTGWEASLGYIISLINGAILPYLISLAFLKDYRYRFVYAFIFFMYCISFLEKAYFLKLAIPLFFVLYHKSKNKRLFLLQGTVGIVVMISLMFLLAGMQGPGVEREEDLFSILYVPTSTFERIVWRAAIVPIVTALDGVRVFLTDLNGQYLMGSSSSVLAFITGAERVNFERLLYQTQFGGTETGNANQYYVIEAFINFGYIGVFIFSFIVGSLIKFSIRSGDRVLLAVMPLLVYNLYSAGLIGTMLSNGFILLFILSKFISLNTETAAHGS